MPRGSEELTNARRAEIVDACAALYETKSFRDITLCDIGQRTSFSRTSIYNYFQTKEEIFLALLQREHEEWTRDLERLAQAERALAVDEFADWLADTLERRGRMLRLMSMNLYDMEANSRLDNLVSFKRAYAGALGAVERCLERHFPGMGAGDRQGFVYALFPFMFGVYPYTAHSPKQLEAMARAQVEYVPHSVHDLVCALTVRLLAGQGAQ